MRRKSVPLTVFLPDEESGTFLMWKAWTHDLGSGAIRFLSAMELLAGTILIRVKFPGRCQAFFEAEIVEVQWIEDGFWQYQTVLGREFPV